MDMCRFSGVQDHEYRKVIGALGFIKGRMSEKQADIEQSSTQATFIVLTSTLNRYRRYSEVHE